MADPATNLERSPVPPADERIWEATVNPCAPLVLDLEGTPVTVARVSRGLRYLLVGSLGLTPQEATHLRDWLNQVLPNPVQAETAAPLRDDTLTPHIHWLT